MVDCPALPTPIKLKTPPFPSPYAEPMSRNTKLQKALDDKLKFAATVHASIANMGVCLVALEGPGANAMAEQNGDTVYFGASMMKVASLYGLFELRTTLRAIADELGCHTGPTELLKQAAKHLNPQILSYTKSKLPSFKGIADDYAVPQYKAAFKAVKKADKTYTVDFSDGFTPKPWSGVGTYTPQGIMEKAIAESHNWSAGQTVHACGYGYLHGALAEGGHFAPKTGKKGVGIFLGGDYIPDFLDDKKTKPNPASYPSYQVESAEGHTSQGSSPIALARLITLLADKQLFGGKADANDGMLDVMAKAVANGHVYINRVGGAKHFKVTHTKLGHSPIAGVEHYSECSILEHDKGKRFVLVWLNLRWGEDPYSEMHAFSSAINDAMDAYLA